MDSWKYTDAMYEEMVPRTPRQNIFDDDDEEYLRLREEITASPEEEVSERLPFAGIVVRYSDEEYLREAVRKKSAEKKRVFFVSRKKGGRYLYDAAAYFNFHKLEFVVLEGSYCEETDYNKALLAEYESRYATSKKDNSFPFERYNHYPKSKERHPLHLSSDVAGGTGTKPVGYVRLRRDLVFQSASVAAGFFMGRETTFLEWKDSREMTLYDRYVYYRASGRFDTEKHFLLANIVCALKIRADESDRLFSKRYRWFPKRSRWF